jgi:uncharacterized protein (DUF1501 family)
MNRKNFLKLIGTATAGTPFLMNGITAQAMNQFLDFPASCIGVNDRALVIVRLAGANDGLNTVIPISQYATYASLRPRLRIRETAPNSYIPLDSTQVAARLLGLHPIMTGFKSLYDAGKLAVFNGVGYPSPNRSHFASENIMFSGKDGTTSVGLKDGIFGRYLEEIFPGLAGNPTTAKPDPLAIQLGNLNPNLFYEHTSAMSIEYNASGFQNDLFNRLARLSSTPANNSEMRELLDYVTSVQASMDVYFNRVNAVFTAGNNSTVSYPSTDLARQLRTVARLIKGGSKTKIFQVNITGWDTHVNQIQLDSSHLGTHATLLGNLSNSIAAFQADIEALGIDNKILTTTFSEFGRNVRENGNLGTDHADLSPFFVIGSNIQPGVYGDHPIFTNTTDFFYNQSQRRFDYRQIFATLMQDWLGANQTVMTTAELDTYNKVPLIKTTANATTNGCLMGTLL